MLTLIQLNNLRDAAKHARTCELSSQVPCELTLAQWALESGWGAHSPGNNCFGIKDFSGCWDKQLLHTHEYFTTETKDKWVAAKDGRIAELQDATFNQHSQQRYQCQDWFASFSTLASCFIKRAELFHTPPYIRFLEQYILDGNFVSLVQGISPIYATDPDYDRKVLQIASLREVQAAIVEARRAQP